MVTALSWNHASFALYLHQTMGPCWDDEEDVHEIVHNASRITHAHPISLIACGIYCSIANEILWSSA